MASCNTPLHNRIHDHPDESTGNGDHDDQGVVEKSLQVPVEPTTATPLPVRNVNGNGNTNGNATEASSLYSPPPLTHHLDYKSKADIRRKELESLRQKQLAKPKAARLQTAQAPTDNLADFENKQRHYILQQRQSEKMALELLHQFRADQESIFKASPDRLARSRQPKIHITPDATASVYSSWPSSATSSISSPSSPKSPNSLATVTNSSHHPLPDELLQTSTMTTEQTNSNNQASQPVLVGSTNPAIDGSQIKNQINLTASYSNDVREDSPVMANGSSPQTNSQCQSNTLELAKYTGFNWTMLPDVVPSTTNLKDSQPNNPVDLVLEKKGGTDIIYPTASLRMDHPSTWDSYPAIATATAVPKSTVGAITPPPTHLQEQVAMEAPPPTAAAPTAAAIASSSISECNEAHADSGLRTGHLEGDPPCDLTTTALPPSTTTSATTGAPAIQQRQRHHNGTREEPREHPPPGLWGFFAMSTSTVSRQRYSRYL